MIHQDVVVFTQFGFIYEKETEKDINGTCPFCHSSGHFGITKNDPNKKWHCFKCGRGGGYRKFLQEVVKQSQGAKEEIAALAEKRGLSSDTLLSLKVGWLNDNWIIPVFAIDGTTILNVKIYDGQSFKNTAGGIAAIYGLWTLPPEFDTVYLCEGEWDTMAMMEMVTDERTAIIGVPGASMHLKVDIINMCIGKSVYLLFDNDTAGRNGSLKALSALTPVASELKVLTWPSETKEGHDVRDVYTKDFNGNAPAALDWIHSHSVLTNIEQSIQTPESVGEHINHQLVYDTFKKWFHLSDNKKYDQKSTDIYDVIFGTVFANRIPGDPVWLYLVAPPGGFKTEPLLSLSGGKLIEIHESVTAPALISGQNQGSTDPSLIPKLNGRLLIIKDWTIILGLPEHERKEILSILRGAFDGVCGRTFGNGVRRDFKSTFGLIAATTPINEQYAEEISSVGERFLTWRNWISEDFDVRYNHIKQALDNTAKEQEMRKEINGISKRVLLSGFKKIPSVDDNVKDTVIQMAQWIAVMRGTVSRDKFHRNVLYKPFSEVGTRLSKEILKLLMGIAVFKGNGSVRPETMRIAKSVAWSSVSTRYAETLKAFLAKGEGLTASEAEKAVGLPQETMQTVIENMMMLGMLDKGKEMKWEIRPSFLKLTKGAKLL